jgi:hypothetical protein
MRSTLGSSNEQINRRKEVTGDGMSRMNKLTPELRKASQPPLSHAGAPAEADRAKRPSLVQPSAPQAELNPGDRVEGLGNFGMPTGQLGTVERANEEDAVVKWDDDGRMRLRQPWLKRSARKLIPMPSQQVHNSIVLTRQTTSDIRGRDNCI